MNYIKRRYQDMVLKMMNLITTVVLIAATNYGTTHGTYSRYNVFRVASVIAIAQLLTITTMPNANMCTARHRESLRRGLPQKLPSKQLL